MPSNFFGDVMPGRADGDLADGAQELFVASRMKGGVDGWTTRYLAKGIWELRPDNTGFPGKIPMTGANVTNEAKIPVAHRLVKFEWKHLTALLADGTDATLAQLDRIDSVPLGNIADRMYYEAASVSSTTIVPFGESYEYVQCTYRLTFNTTNTDWIVPILWVQELKP